MNLVRARHAAHPAAAPVACAAAAVGAVCYVSQVDPGQPGHYPVCPFYAITGYYCPLCGSLRAVYALTHGDLAAALHDNVLTMTALPLLVWLWSSWLISAMSQRSPGSGRAAAHPALIWLSATAVGAFWLVRNLPAGHFLAPLGH